MILLCFSLARFCVCLYLSAKLLTTCLFFSLFVTESYISLASLTLLRSISSYALAPTLSPLFPRPHTLTFMPSGPCPYDCTFSLSLSLSLSRRSSLSMYLPIYPIAHVCGSLLSSLIFHSCLSHTISFSLFLSLSLSHRSYLSHTIPISRTHAGCHTYTYTG